MTDRQIFLFLMEIINCMFNTNIWTIPLTLLMSIFILTGCGDDEYTLHLTIDGKGTITLNDKNFDDSTTVTYEENDIVTVSYSQLDDWEFKEYTGDLTGSSSSKKLTMNSDKHFTAIFSLINSVAITGTVYDDSNNTPLQNVIVTSGSGYNQVSTITNSNGEYSMKNVYVPSDRYVYIQFTKTEYYIDEPYKFYKNKSEMILDPVYLKPEKPYHLTIDTIGEGSWQVFPVSESMQYSKDTSVTLVAIPSPKWLFRGWQGSISSSNQQVDLIMDSDKTVTCVFGVPYAKFMGQITDDNGESLHNVKVMAGAQSTFTDTNGLFWLNNVSLPENSDKMVILFQKQGYCLYSSNHPVSDQIEINVYPQLNNTCNMLASIIQTLKVLSGKTSEVIAFDIDANNQPNLSEVVYMLQILAE